MKPALSVALLCSLLVNGCAHQTPETPPLPPTPPQWQEAGPDSTFWKTATPSDQVPRGAWWTLLGDPTLNQLQANAQSSNLSLQVAVARLQQAQALTTASRADLWPQLGLTAYSARQRAAADDDDSDTETYNKHGLGLSGNYEVDLFGRVSGSIDAAELSEQQEAANLEYVRLLVSSEVAATYFELRALEEELTILEQFLQAQNRVLEIVRARQRDGVATGIDLAQQNLIVSTTQTDQQRLQLEHARLRHRLATLTGITGAQLQWNGAGLPDQLPALPALLPAELLERRPDIASAERAVAAANARIGVAHSGWFPRVNLTLQGGQEAQHLHLLLDTPSQFWSLGVTLSQLLWDGGRTKALEQAAVAAHSEASAQYRHTVLSAWEEVEGALAGQRQLSNAHEQSANARQAAESIASITERRYQAGLVGAIERYTAQQNALDAQRRERRLLGERWLNRVELVKALGGGWETPEQLASNTP